MPHHRVHPMGTGRLAALPLAALPLAVLLLASWLSSAGATTFVQPERHDVYSPNKRFVMDVDPETEVHNIYAVADRSQPLWSFSQPVWHGEWYLANDGAVAATLSWRFVQQDRVKQADGVRFWNAGGNFRSYGLVELAPQPAITSWGGLGPGPIGSFWRTWYTDAEQTNDTFRLVTTDCYAYTFSLIDGSITSRRLTFAALRYKLWFWPSLAALALGGVIAAGWWLRRIKT